MSEREILNGILYVEHVRCPWRMLPHDLPPWGTVYYYYSLWRENGALMKIRLQLGR